MKYWNAVKSVLPAVVLGFLTLGLASTSAVAQTDPATTTFGVSAVVLKDCIVSATALQFGNYTGAVNNATSTITVTCTNTTGYTVGLSAGTGYQATVTNRLMSNGTPGAGTPTLPYALYSNSGMTTNWGNTSATNWVSGTGNGTAQALPVYGQVAAGLYVTPGTYTDTITATVTY